MHADLIMHTQACSCMHMNLPQNPKPNFSDFIFDFTCNASIFYPFSYIFGFKSLFHMFVCFAHVRIRVYFVFYLFWCHEHAFTCSCMYAIGAKLLQGKWGRSCIHLNMHLWIWFCLMIDLNMFFRRIMLNHMFAWTF